VAGVSGDDVVIIGRPRERTSTTIQMRHTWDLRIASIEHMGTQISYYLLNPLSSLHCFIPKPSSMPDPARADTLMSAAHHPEH
jgi:hypothetical protein